MYNGKKKYTGKIIVFVIVFVVVLVLASMAINSLG